LMLPHARQSRDCVSTAVAQPHMNSRSYANPSYLKSCALCSYRKTLLEERFFAAPRSLPRTRKHTAKDIRRLFFGGRETDLAAMASFVRQQSRMRRKAAQSAAKFRTMSASAKRVLIGVPLTVARCFSRDNCPAQNASHRSVKQLIGVYIYGA